MVQYNWQFTVDGHTIQSPRPSLTGLDYVHKLHTLSYVFHLSATWQLNNLTATHNVTHFIPRLVRLVFDWPLGQSPCLPLTVVLSIHYNLHVP